MTRKVCFTDPDGQYGTCTREDEDCSKCGCILHDIRNGTSSKKDTDLFLITGEQIKEIRDGCYHEIYNVLAEVERHQHDPEQEMAAVRCEAIWEVLTDLGFGCVGEPETFVCEKCEASRYCRELRQQRGQ